jgi:hypothetical protein
VARGAAAGTFGTVLEDMLAAAAAERQPRLEAAGLLRAPSILVDGPVAAGAERVWSVIARSGNLTDLHPFCASTEVERWPGLDARDHIHYWSGLHYERDCVAWREGEGYVLEVGPPGEPKVAAAAWLVQPVGADHCRFGIEVTPYLRADVGAERLAAYRRDVVATHIPPYLRSVVQGVAHFAETGQPVERNRFGPHPLYSPSINPEPPGPR